MLLHLPHRLLLPREGVPREERAAEVDEDWLGDCFVGVRLLGAEHTQYSGAGGFNGGPNLVPAQPLELIE